MGYRDDLYRPVHMIGYTGALNAFPSVYFFNPEDGCYGHITQQHTLPANIGRESVKDHEDYRISNEFIDGKTRNVERRNGRIFHRSRNPFVPICDSRFFPNAKTDFRCYALLAPAIVRFPEMKEWSRMGRDEREAHKRRYFPT
ncbi:MAG: hypothetical protein HKN30_15215 [Sulfitobacter sp.]|nr:hypothetical protein [Sulfitobacter sp.]